MIDIKLKKMCDKAFPEDSFILKYCLDRYKTQEMSDKAVDNFSSTLKFVPDWFVTSKTMKNLILLHLQMTIYSLLMNILVTPHLQLTKWLFFA